MEYVSLSSYPNQKFSVNVNNYVLSFTLQYSRGFTFVTVTSSEGVTLCQSELAVDRGWLFPERFEKGGYGNFRFEDDECKYPTYENFNGTCVLVHYDREEAVAKRFAERE